MAWSMLRSGSMAWLMRSAATEAIQTLMGSAFLNVTDCMIRNIPFRSAQRIYCGPPSVIIVRVGTNCTHPLANSGSQSFIRFTYCFGSRLSTMASITSSTTKYHSSSFSTQPFESFCPRTVVFSQCPTSHQCFLKNRKKRMQLQIKLTHFPVSHSDVILA